MEENHPWKIRAKRTFVAVAVDRDTSLVPQKSKVNPRQNDYEGQAVESLLEVAIKVNVVFDIGKSGDFDGLRLGGKKLFCRGGVSKSGQLGPKIKWARLETKRPSSFLGGLASTLKPSLSQAMSLNKRVGFVFSKKVGSWVVPIKPKKTISKRGFREQLAQGSPLGLPLFDSEAFSLGLPKPTSKEKDEVSL